MDDDGRRDSGPSRPLPAWLAGPVSVSPSFSPSKVRTGRPQSATGPSRSEQDDERSVGAGRADNTASAHRPTAGAGSHSIPGTRPLSSSIHDKIAFWERAVAVAPRRAAAAMATGRERASLSIEREPEQAYSRALPDGAGEFSPARRDEEDGGGEASTELEPESRLRPHRRLRPVSEIIRPLFGRRWFTEPAAPSSFADLRDEQEQYFDDDNDDWLGPVGYEEGASSSGYDEDECTGSGSADEYDGDRAAAVPRASAFHSANYARLRNANANFERTLSTIASLGDMGEQVQQRRERGSASVVSDVLQTEEEGDEEGEVERKGEEEERKEAALLLEQADCRPVEEEAHEDDNSEIDEIELCAAAMSRLCLDEPEEQQPEYRHSFFQENVDGADWQDGRDDAAGREDISADADCAMPTPPPAETNYGPVRSLRAAFSTITPRISARVKKIALGIRARSLGAKQAAAAAAAGGDAGNSYGVEGSDKNTSGSRAGSRAAPLPPMPPPGQLQHLFSSQDGRSAASSTGAADEQPRDQTQTQAQAQAPTPEVQPQSSQIITRRLSTRLAGSIRRGLFREKTPLRPESRAEASHGGSRRMSSAIGRDDQPDGPDRSREPERSQSRAEAGDEAELAQPGVPLFSLSSFDLSLASPLKQGKLAQQTVVWDGYATSSNASSGALSAVDIPRARPGQLQPPRPLQSRLRRQGSLRSLFSLAPPPRSDVAVDSVRSESASPALTVLHTPMSPTARFSRAMALPQFGPGTDLPVDDVAPAPAPAPAPSPLSFAERVQARGAEWAAGTVDGPPRPPPTAEAGPAFHFRSALLNSYGGGNVATLPLSSRAVSPVNLFEQGAPVAEQEAVAPGQALYPLPATGFVKPTARGSADPAFLSGTPADPASERDDASTSSGARSSSRCNNGSDDCGFLPPVLQNSDSLNTGSAALSQSSLEQQHQVLDEIEGDSREPPFEHSTSHFRPSRAQPLLDQEGFLPRPRPARPYSLPNCQFNISHHAPESASQPYPEIHSVQPRYSLSHPISPYIEGRPITRRSCNIFRENSITRLSPFSIEASPTSTTPPKRLRLKNIKKHRLSTNSLGSGLKIHTKKKGASFQRRNLDVRLRLTVNWTSAPKPLKPDEPETTDANMRARLSEEPKPIELKRLARIHGFSVLVLPRHVSPVPTGLPVPVGVAAAGKMITQALDELRTTRPRRGRVDSHSSTDSDQFISEYANSIPGIFRIPGKSVLVAQLADHFGIGAGSVNNLYSTEDARSVMGCPDLVEVTIRSSDMPRDGCHYGIHEAASVFKRMFSVIKGGILGDIDTWQAIQACTFIDPDTDERRLDAQGVSTILLNLKSSYRRSLIIAAFGLLRVVAEDRKGILLTEKNCLEHEMTARSISLIFAPLLLGEEGEHLPIEKVTSIPDPDIQTPTQMALRRFWVKTLKSPSAEKSPQKSPQKSYRSPLALLKSRVGKPRMPKAASNELVRLMACANLIEDLLKEWTHIVAKLNPGCGRCSPSSITSSFYTPISPNFSTYGSVSRWLSQGSYSSQEACQGSLDGEQYRIPHDPPQVQMSLIGWGGRAEPVAQESCCVQAMWTPQRSTVLETVRGRAELQAPEGNDDINMEDEWMRLPTRRNSIDHGLQDELPNELDGNAARPRSQCRGNMQSPFPGCCVHENRVRRTGSTLSVRLGQWGSRQL